MNWPSDDEIKDYFQWSKDVKVTTPIQAIEVVNWLRKRMKAVVLNEEEIGSLCYRGNTVRYIYDKLTNYSNQLGAAGTRLRELGFKLTGSLEKGYSFERDMGAEE